MEGTQDMFGDHVERVVEGTLSPDDTSSQRSPLGHSLEDSPDQFHFLFKTCHGEKSSHILLYPFFFRVWH